MEHLLDLYGFVSVILHALELAAVTTALGGAVFLAALVVPAAAAQPGAGAAILAIGRRCTIAAGGAALAAILLNALLQAGALMAMLQAPLVSVLGAGVFRSTALAALAALALVLLAAPRTEPGGGRRGALLLAALALLAALTAGSHALARQDGRPMLLAATALHLAGAALWIGGLPALALCLHLPEAAAREVGRRYSAFAASGVALILLGVLGFWVGYIGSPAAVYGTAYGSMAAAKLLFLGLLLALGAANFLLLHRLAQPRLALSVGAAAVPGPSAGLLRLRRFVECEMALGIAVLAVAASLTSVPPAIDLPDDRVTWQDIQERFTPEWPRFASPSHEDLTIADLQARLDDDWHRRQAQERPQALAPGELLLPPRSAQDIAWSEYNHHWAGIMVLLVGLAALLDATGRVAFARHWPLIFLGLAGFLFVRSDPEAWPLGAVGLLDSLRDPEVVQHKIAALLVVGFAIAEWGVRLGWLRGRLRFVFPLAMLAGGVLLLAHTHAISNIREAQLIELSHLPLAVLAVVGGCARWVELRGPPVLARPARGVWPACLFLIGLLLLLYREA